MNKCKLLDLSTDEVVVAEGRWQTQDPKALVNGLPLGPRAVKVFVDVVNEPNTFIWRPTMDVTYIEDCLLSFVAWPFSKVVFENNPDASTRLSPTQNSASSSKTAVGKTAPATSSKSRMQTASATCDKSPTKVPKSTAKETQTSVQSPLRRSPVI